MFLAHRVEGTVTAIWKVVTGPLEGMHGTLPHAASVLRLSLVRGLDHHGDREVLFPVTEEDLILVELHLARTPTLNSTDSVVLN